MEIARLILDFLKALVWPAVVLAVAYGFREELRGLLRRMKVLSAVGVDAEFSEVVEQVSVDVGEAVAQSEPQAIESSALTNQGAEGRERGTRLAVPFIDPSVALLEAWHQVRSALTRMTLEHTSYGRIGERLLNRLLWSERFFPRDIAHSLRELQAIANEVRNGKRIPTMQAAEDYIASCEAMVDWLREYAKSPAWADGVAGLELPA
ncbi:hypothetical protein [Streptomyces sp. NPDC059010]|uniref:hypothetical protein n=1 Tax=Streptomyces sp. NPDC059010 TaxID=3346695 RepID=UPI0036C40DEA